MTTPEGANAQRERIERAEAVVAHEWNQFQQVTNAGGRAECQDDWRTFQQMRLSQFLTWPVPLLESYAADLVDADMTGRNLLTEKYARMMASTDPEQYRKALRRRLPVLAADRVTAQERIIATQVAWAREFSQAYPNLGAGMRVLRTEQDSPEATSFETYLRGELSTYSARTLELYGLLVQSKAAAGENLTAQTIHFTAVLGGFATLEEAEAAQAAG